MDLNRRTFASALPAAVSALRAIAYGEGVNEKMPVKPFSVHFDNALRGDLRPRLANTRWSDAVTGDWQYGTNKSFLKELVEYWQTTYNFDAAEQRMNVMPQFRTSIAGFGVHYVYKGAGTTAQAAAFDERLALELRRISQTGSHACRPCCVWRFRGRRIRCCHARASRIWLLGPADPSPSSQRRGFIQHLDD
jgi:hypothetical protein